LYNVILPCDMTMVWCFQHTQEESGEYRNHQRKVCCISRCECVDVLSKARLVAVEPPRYVWRVRYEAFQAPYGLCNSETRRSRSVLFRTDRSDSARDGRRPVETAKARMTEIRVQECCLDKTMSLVVGKVGCRST